MKFGVSGGDVDAFLDTTSGAVAALTLNAVIDGESASERLRLAAGAVIRMEIETATMTAGKVELVLELNAQ